MVDHAVRMDATPASSREVWFVGVSLALTAVLYRYAWIPDSWTSILENFERTTGLDVGGVGAWFSGWATGDGQTFALIAADPLGLDEGWQLTQPVYRYGRAGFGWLAWLASLGQEQWVPYGLAIAGATAVVGTFLVAMRLRPRLGVRAWLIAFNPAVLIAFAGDTAEALGILAAAWAMATGRWWASAALGVIRPTFLVAFVGRWRLLLWGALSAAGLGLLWILRFGPDLDQYGGGLTLPFHGYIESPSIQSTGLLILAIVTIGVGVRHRDWGWVGSGLLVMCFSPLVLGGAHNAWRAAGMLYVLWAFGPGYSGQLGDPVASSESMPTTA